MPIDTQRVADLLNAHPDWDLRRIAAEIEGPGDGPTAAELAETRARTGLRSESFPPGAEPAVDVHTRMLREFHGVRAEGHSREAAFGAGIDVLMSAAMDPQHPQHDQAVYDHDRWNAEQRFRQTSGARA